jgi:hypothetical protein
VRKVVSGALAGAFTVVIAAVLPEQIGGKPVSPEVATALTTLFMSLVAYVTPPAAGEVVEPADTAKPEPRPMPERPDAIPEVQFLQARVEWTESFLQALAQRLFFSVSEGQHPSYRVETWNGRRQRPGARLKRMI